MKKLAKDFSGIQNDYAFYISHSTQNQADLSACRDTLQKISIDQKTLHLLDFGCGPGLFLSKLLKSLAWPPNKVELTLAEPVEDYRRQAVKNVAPYTTLPITATRLLSDDERRFDVLLASHMLYYVGDLSTMLPRLVGKLAPGGVLIASIADRENFLVKIWLEGFKLLEKDLPYNIGDDVASTLHRLQIPHTLKPLAYQLRFPDVAENRLAIIRFLMGDYLRECPLDPLYAMFDEYSAGGEVRINTRHMQFVVNA